MDVQPAPSSWSLTVTSEVDAGGVYLYHTDPEAPGPADGSPVSRFAPTVVPKAGNVDTAATKASLSGAGVTAMLTSPLCAP